VLTEI